MKTPSSLNTRAYASIVSCGSLAKDVEARKAKDDLLSLVLDFKCHENPGAPVTDKVIADFLFDELRLQRSEIIGLVQLGGGSVQRSIKVETARPLNIKSRFEDKIFYQREVAGRKWLCSIRSGNSASYMRFFNVPGWVVNEELLIAIASFAKPLGEIEKEYFGKFQDPRLSGLTNGHRRLLVSNLGAVPDFVSIGSKKIRIYHRDQIPKCFTCRQEGHIKANCPSAQKLVEATKLPVLQMEEEQKEAEEPTSESDDSVVFEDCTKENGDPQSSNKAKHQSILGVPSNVANKNADQDKPPTGIMDSVLLGATPNLNAEGDHDQSLSPHLKRKSPSSATTPVSTDANITKKKGRTDKEAPPKTVVTRSESSAL